MAQNKTVRFGPLQIPITTAEPMVYPGTRDGSTRAAVGWAADIGDLYVIIKHIRLVNTSASPVSVSMGISTTGAAPSAVTAVIVFGTSIPANSQIDWYGALRLNGTTNAQYLNAVATVDDVVTFQGEGEVGIV